MLLLPLALALAIAHTPSPPLFPNPSLPAPALCTPTPNRGPARRAPGPNQDPRPGGREARNTSMKPHDAETVLSGANQTCQLSSSPSGFEETQYFVYTSSKIRTMGDTSVVMPTCRNAHAYMSQHRHNKLEAREIRTPNLLIWSQTRCRCAIAPWITIWLASARTFSNTLHKFLNFTYLSAWFASRSGDDIWVQKTLVAMNRILMESTS